MMHESSPSPQTQPGSKEAVAVDVTVHRWVSRVSIATTTLENLQIGAPSIAVEPLDLPLPVNSLDVGLETMHSGGVPYWLPCLPPPEQNKANGTRTITWATGPEDPRVQVTCGLAGERWIRVCVCVCVCVQVMGAPVRQITDQTSRRGQIDYGRAWKRRA